MQILKEDSHGAQIRHHPTHVDGLSLLIQFLGLLFVVGFVGELIHVQMGFAEPEAGKPTVGEAAFSIVAGLVLFIMGRASLRTQKRLGKY